MSGQRWLVVLAHGSRDPRWRRPFEHLASRLTEEGCSRISLAYLQLCQPGLAEVLARCREQGATEVHVVPAFLSGGGHLLRDVGDEVHRAAATVPGLQVTMSGALGEEPEVLEGMLRACLRMKDCFEL